MNKNTYSRNEFLSLGTKALAFTGLVSLLPGCNTKEKDTQEELDGSKKTLLATQAGVVFPELDQYYLFKAPYYLGQPEASGFASGKGKPVLYTEGIKVCAGISLRTKNSYGLLHAMGLKNTRILLEAIIDKHSQLEVPLEEVKIQIKTDNMREDYEKIVRDYFVVLDIDPEIHQIGDAQILDRLKGYSLEIDHN